MKMTADTKFISLALAITAGLGILIFLNGGWIGLGLYAVVLFLIFGGAA